MKLTDMFGEQLWPADLPQTLYRLADAEPEDLPKVARDLRAQAVDLIRRDGLTRVTTFADVVDSLSAGKVFHPITGRWRSYAIDADRHPILEPATSASRRWKVVTTVLAPTPDDLPPLPGAKYGQRPGWIVVYGGTIDVLAKKGVVGRLMPTVRRRLLLDIVGAGAGPTWSVRNGVAADGTTTMNNLEPDGYWDVLKGAMNGQ